MEKLAFDQIERLVALAERAHREQPSSSSTYQCRTCLDVGLMFLDNKNEGDMFCAVPCWGCERGARLGSDGLPRAGAINVQEKHDAELRAVIDRKERAKRETERGGEGE